MSDTAKNKKRGGIQYRVADHYPHPPVHTRDASAASAGPAARGAGWVLGLTSAAQFVLQLDFSIVNIALPTLQRELGFSAAGLQWVVTGYALAYGALLLVGGRIGDLVGARAALVAGLVGFGASSLAGGLAITSTMLVIARFFQGASAAVVAPAALGMLTQVFSGAADRARALGVFQGATAGGATAGIVLGGVLTQYLGWRSVLLVNPPVIAILIVVMMRTLPKSTVHRTAGSPDLSGAALITAAVAALIYGLSEGQQNGFGQPVALGTLAASVVLGAGFVLVERRVRNPMLPIDLLGSRSRDASLIVMFLLGGVVAGYVYFVSLYMQSVLKLSPLLNGIGLIPATATVMATSVYGARAFLPRFGPRVTLLIALILIGGGQLWLSLLTPDGGYLTNVLGGVLLTAMGMGLALPTASFVITSGVPPREKGVAGSTFVAAQQIGAAVGLAVLATVAAARTAATGGQIDGFALAFLVAAGIVAAAAATVMTLRPQSPGQTDETGADTEQSNASS